MKNFSKELAYALIFGCLFCGSEMSAMSVRNSSVYNPTVPTTNVVQQVESSEPTAVKPQKKAEEPKKEELHIPSTAGAVVGGLAAAGTLAGAAYAHSKEHTNLRNGLLVGAAASAVVSAASLIWKWWRSRNNKKSNSSSNQKQAQKSRAKEASPLVSLNSR